jgi:magnesium transporter
VTDFYRAVHPLLAVLATLERDARETALLLYFRDDLVLVNEEVAAQRDLLATVLEANMAVIGVEQTKVSVRQNATMEQLTVLAAVFLPLTGGLVPPTASSTTASSTTAGSTTASCLSTVR